MDFEAKRKKILDTLSKQRREKSISRKVASSKKTVSGSAIQQTASQQKCKKRPQLVIFGAQSFFMRGFVQSMKALGDVVYFSDHEKASNFCLEQDLFQVLLDMDEPTDHRFSIDIFTSIKTVKPECTFFLLSSDLESMPLKALAAQGGVVISKPINFEELQELIKIHQPIDGFEEKNQ